MARKQEPSVGWVDLCLKFANEGLPVPPIPQDHRAKLVRDQVREQDDEWLWSTRPDVLWDMLSDEYVEELLTGHVDDYSTIAKVLITLPVLCVNIVKSPVAIIFRSTYRAHRHPLPLEGALFAACFLEMGALLEAAANFPESDQDRRRGPGIAHFLVLSEIGAQHDYEYHARDRNGHWVRETRTMPPHGRHDVNAWKSTWRDEDLGTACRRVMKNLAAEDESKSRDGSESETLLLSPSEQDIDSP
jgi:hypothetical protein